MTLKEYITMGIAVCGLLSGVLAMIYSLGRKEQTFIADIAVIKDKVDALANKSVVRMNTRVDEVQKELSTKLSLKDFKEFKIENASRQKDLFDGLASLSDKISILCTDMAAIKKELEISNGNGKSGKTD